MTIEDEISGSFQEAVGTVLAVVQFFGIMPVIGVTSDSASKLRFQWNSIRTIFSVLCFAITVGYTLLCIRFVFVNELSLDRMGKLNINYKFPEVTSYNVLMPLQFQLYSLYQHLLECTDSLFWQENGHV